MADVFISYAREDRDWAEVISSALEQLDVSTWWDDYLLAGENFSATIEKELNSAHSVIMLWSKSAQQSRWVHAEAISAFERGSLIVCKLDDTKLTVPFNAVHTLDPRVQGWPAQVLDALEAKKRNAEKAADSENFLRLKRLLVGCGYSRELIENFQLSDPPDKLITDGYWESGCDGDLPEFDRFTSILKEDFGLSLEDLEACRTFRRLGRLMQNGI